MVSPVVLEGSHVRLEPLSIKHVDGLLAAATEAARPEFAFIPGHREAMESYVGEALAQQSAGQQVPFAIRWLDESRIVGTSRFFGVKPWVWPVGSMHQRHDTPDAVEIGATWLAASARRTPVNTEAKLLMLGHAFDTWRVHRVSFRTDVRNGVSRRAIERLGARFEGVCRADKAGADDTVRDSACYSIVAAEWPSCRAALSRR